MLTKCRSEDSMVLRYWVCIVSSDGKFESDIEEPHPVAAPRLHVMGKVSH